MSTTLRGVRPNLRELNYGRRLGVSSVVFAYALEPAATCGPLVEACVAVGQAGASSVGAVLGDAAGTYAFDRVFDVLYDDYVEWRPWGKEQ